MNNNVPPQRPDLLRADRVEPLREVFHVLVIDDDPQVCESVEAVARDEGMAVSVLHSGKGLSPDMLEDKQLIVLDLMMPGIDGVQLMDIVKAADPQPAILLISGVDTPALESAIRLARSKGLAVESLSKPFRAKALSAVLRRHAPQRLVSAWPDEPWPATHNTPGAKDVLEALAQGAIRVDLMPTYRLRTHSWHSITAVCRWQHSDLGVLEPPLFRHTLRDASVATRYFRALLPSAVNQYLTLARLSTGGGRLSFAMPGVLLDSEEAITFITETLAGLGMDPAALTLDIQHADLGGSFDAALQAQARLQMRKIRLCISDFDISVSDLKKLWASAFREVKVAVASLNQPDERTLLTQRLRHLASEAEAHAVAVVATGVDTPITHGLIQGLGIAFAQGTYLCEPMPATALAARMRGADLLLNSDGGAGQSVRRVLLVEPNPFLKHVYAHHLRRHGLEVDLAENGDEAQTLRATQNYQLMIIDTAPPQGLNTHQLAAIDSLLANTIDLPVLALTEEFAQAREASSMLSRASSIMPRPIQLGQLRSESVRLIEAGAAALFG